MNHSIAQALAWAADTLKSGETPAIDARALLCSVLGCHSTFLFTWPDKLLTEEQWQLYQANVMTRKQGNPVAHITGERGFWSLALNVNSHTLIPRPETELLVEHAVNKLTPLHTHVCDLGTGLEQMSYRFALVKAVLDQQPAISRKMFKGARYNVPDIVKTI